MEIKDATDAISAIVALLGAVGALVGGIRYGVVRPFQRWIREQVSVPMQQVATEVGVPESKSDPESPTLKDLAIGTGLRVNALEQRFEDHLRSLHGS